MLNLEN
ncbi:hypothetical protein E2I00_013369 [Balaenoptera physalus]|nr:hypothetical protein E2I00_013369 [Balaenoptera physalus]